MSHFSQIKTQIRELVPLQSALSDLGVEWKSGDLCLRGHQGDQAAAAIAISQPNGYDIGFRWNGSSYELVADLQYWQQPWHVESFLQQLTQRYAYHTVVDEARLQGFDLTQSERQADGSMRLVLQRWHG